MRTPLLLLSLAVGIQSADLAYGNRPRGVSEAQAALYEEKDEFQCLDGSKAIPFERVNDDYCDCPDGSDEPGTSACSNGHFHCRNHGFKPLDLPSSRVNDFICDCCDGSDEWDSETQCADVCAEIHAKVKSEADQLKEKVARGFARRRELAEQGAKSMAERRAQLDQLKLQRDDLKPVEELKKQARDEAEGAERDAKKAEDDRWRALVVQARQQDAADLFSRAAKDGKVTKEDVKQAIKAASDKDITDDQLRDLFDEDAEIAEDRFLAKIVDLRRWFKRDLLKPTTTPRPDTLDEDDLLDPEPIDDEPDQEPDPETQPDYSEQTTKLIEEANAKRDDYQTVSDKLQDIEHKIGETERFLQFEYGADAAWAPLKGECVELSQAQYTYRLCLFERAAQVERSGAEIRLGDWREWEEGFGVQRYADGQTCWNGPPRSTRVRVECGERLELLEASEPNRCEYEFRLRAPPACPDPASLADPYAIHSEL